MTLDPKKVNSKPESEESKGAEPLTGGGNLGDLTVLADWRRIPFLMVDSAHTKRFEDAVAAKRFHHRRSWSADLKVIHPLPLDEFVSLRRGVPQVCLGIRDYVDSRGGRDPSVSLVIAENLTGMTDLQAEAFLNGRGRTVTGIAGHNVLEPSMRRRLQKQLRTVRATALDLSYWRDRELTPPHAVEILAGYARSAAILASRNFEPCPTLVVLRRQGSRDVGVDDLGVDRNKGQLKSRFVTGASGSAVPTILREGDTLNQHDVLRIKERGNSGAINMTQITCALLGIAPIPDHLVQQGVRSDSQVDKWKNGGPLPAPLSAAINQRRHDIRDVLTDLTRGLFPQVL